MNRLLSISLFGVGLTYMLLVDVHCTRQSTQFWGDLMAGWLGYLVCLFGAFFGVVIAAIRALIRETRGVITAAIDGFCFLGAGVALSACAVHLL